LRESRAHAAAALREGLGLYNPFHRPYSLDVKDDHDLRTRRYVAKNTLLLLSPFFRYSYSRDAFVLRGIGRSVGPVLRLDRRRLRDGRPLDGIERRAPRIA
jgi:hypothetical protein